MAETIPGGAYRTAAGWVDANGKPLAPEVVAQLTGQPAEAPQAPAGGKASEPSMADLKAKALELGVDIKGLTKKDQVAQAIADFEAAVAAKAAGETAPDPPEE